MMRDAIKEWIGETITAWSSGDSRVTVGTLRAVAEDHLVVMLEGRTSVALVQLSLVTVVAEGDHSEEAE